VGGFSGRVAAPIVVWGMSDEVPRDLAGAGHRMAWEYEAAQKRVLEVFASWEMPESLTIHQFLVRVGEFGGYAVVETDSAADLQYLCTAFAIFSFTVEPVLDVMDAVAAESRGIEWRDSLPSS
jgi:hypothetical protein